VKAEIAETCKEKKCGMKQLNWLCLVEKVILLLRKFTSLYDVSSLIVYYTSKIIVKSSYCKVCEFWIKKESSAEYEEWLNTRKEECHANHEESSGKMEVEAITEMFKRYQKTYDVKYT